MATAEIIHRRSMIHLEMENIHGRADELARHAATWLAGLGTIWTAEPGSDGAKLLQRAVDSANERDAILAKLVKLQAELDSLD